MSNGGISSDAGPTYLLADDHTGFRRALRCHLPGDTFTVVECADGEEAVEAYERHHPDWTLMDMEMPGMDGLTATRSILSQHPEARIIVLTQHDSSEMNAEAQAAGAVALLPKDRLSELPNLIRSHVPSSHRHPDPHPMS